VLLPFPKRRPFLVRVAVPVVHTDDPNLHMVEHAFYDVRLNT
jgi:hypothetical protein